MTDSENQLYLYGKEHKMTLKNHTTTNIAEYNTKIKDEVLETENQHSLYTNKLYIKNEIEEDIKTEQEDAHDDTFTTVLFEENVPIKTETDDNKIKYGESLQVIQPEQQFQVSVQKHVDKLHLEEVFVKGEPVELYHEIDIKYDPLLEETIAKNNSNIAIRSEAVRNTQPKSVAKRCLVSICGNTDKLQPEKVFVLVPSKVEVRKKWFEAIFGAEKEISKTTRLYVCEDHFNLNEDAHNYIEHKILQRRLILKSSAVPHINLSEVTMEPHEKKRKLQNLTQQQQLNFGELSDGSGSFTGLEELLGL